MRATSIEFRLRGLILTLIVIIGFWAPWIQALDLGKRVSLLEWLALELSRSGLLRFTLATPVVILMGALFAAVGMVLRIAGAAHLGHAIVHDGRMHGSELVTSGPYRYLRNPLYLGGWCMIVAISLLMPPSGALVGVLLVTLFYLRLILVEEAFLGANAGAAYNQYLRAVPRIFPRLRSPLPRGDTRPQWLMAASTELISIGVFFTLAVLAWTYDNLLMIKAILISFGVSLVAQALAPGKTAPAHSDSDAA
jgi:protein-S-isoprenylcysteine O-methyltransferase Ste14